MKKTLTLHDGTPVELDTDDVVSEEVLHQGGEVGETAWEINELTMTTGLKVQVEEQNVVHPVAAVAVKAAVVEEIAKPEPPKPSLPDKPNEPSRPSFGDKPGPGR